MTETDTSAEAVERFDLEQPMHHMSMAEMVAMPGFGDWVRYEDYATLAAKVEALEAERDRCHARLEIDRVYDMELQRVEIPLKDRLNQVDGIEARDCTITQLEERIAELEVERAASIGDVIQAAHLRGQMDGRDKERERCAKVAENCFLIVAPESVSQRVGAQSVREAIAAAIRKGDE